MATTQNDPTRDALARIHGWRTAILSGAVVLLICLQRPLGIDAEGLATVKWILCANLLIELPITRFYFPRPRIPRTPPKGKFSIPRAD